MARPTVEQRNRASGNADFQRQRAAPGIAVQAPLNVAVAPNGFQELANILGVATQAATSHSAQVWEQKRREREEDEALASTAAAEADVWQSNVDPERIKSDRVYARRVSTLSGARLAAETSEKLATDFEKWREENPLADETQARQWIADWQESALVDDEGNPLEALSDLQQEAIIRSQLGQTAFQLISKDRDVWRDNVKNHGATEAGGLFLSIARQNKGVKIEDYENLRVTLRSLGWSEDEVNQKIAEYAFAAAEELESPDPLRLLPAKWSDGSAGPIANAERARAINSQGDLFQARQEAAAMKALEPLQLQLRLQLEDKAARGEDPTDEEISRAYQLGMSTEAIASVFGRARSARVQMQKEAEREARDAQRHQETMEALQGQPWSVDKNKAEDAYTREFQNAGTPDEKAAVIRRAIRERGVLPGIYRNYLNRIPTGPDKLDTWAGGMRDLRNMDRQVYASLGQDARTFFEAYEAVKASGRYNSRQAFERLQIRDPQAGKTLVASEAGKALIEEMVGDDATPAAYANARQLIETFGSFSDMPRSEALHLAKKSYEATYFTKDGAAFHKGYMKDPEMVDWAKSYFSRELARRGQRYDPDDLVIMPVGRGDMFTVRERNGIRPILPAFSYDLLRRGFRDSEEKSIRRKYGAAAFDAAKRGLKPERHIPGERDRLGRMKLERQATDALGKLNKRK